MLCIAEDLIKFKDYDYSLLPPHVIANIFTHMKVDEFRNAALTCKSWYYASCDPIATKNIIVNLCKCDTNYAMRSVTYLNIDMHDWKTMQYKYNQYLKKFGIIITEVDLDGIITLTEFLQIILHLPHIRILKILDQSRESFHSQANYDGSKIFAKYKDEILRNLASIKSIDIFICFKQDLTEYELLISHCPNIEIMRWSDYSDSTIDKPNEFLFNFLLEPAKNPALYKLSKLRLAILEQTQTKMFFEKMVKLELRQLRNLSLKHISPNYHTVMFNEFCKMYSGLKSLTITCCSKHQLTNLCKYMKELKKFKIYDCTANNLEEISNLKNLEALLIDRRGVVHDYGLSLLLIGNNLSFLKKLRINKISLTALNMICENLTNLEDLTLMEVETKEFELLYRNMLKLKILRLSLVDGAKPHSSRIESPHKYNITNLTELVELEVDCYIPGITPELLKQMPKLKEIEIHP